MGERHMYQPGLGDLLIMYKRESYGYKPVCPVTHQSTVKFFCIERHGRVSICHGQKEPTGCIIPKEK